MMNCGNSIMHACAIDEMVLEYLSAAAGANGHDDIG